MGEKATDGDWDGGYMESKKRKLDEQAQKEMDRKSSIFAGVSIYVDGYTDPSSDKLKKMVTDNGGRYSHYYSKSNRDFIIALNLPQQKIRNLSANERVVKPCWIVDSISAGKLLPYEKYQLYKSNLNQPTLGFQPQQPEKSISPTKNRQAPRAGDPNFLSEFFANSRLHHLSTWAGELRDLVARLKRENAGKSDERKFPGRTELLEFLRDNVTSSTTSGETERTVMHIDMDCFFVSVGLVGRPELRGRPVAVTHSSGRGPGGFGQRPGRSNPQWEFDYYVRGGSVGPVEAESSQHGAAAEVSMEDFVSYAEIASCSYEARSRGLRNGMLLGHAKKLCPDLTTIPYDFNAYHETAMTLYRCVASLTDAIEAVSCDELFADCTELLVQTRCTPLQLATFLREKIRALTHCPCSSGFGPNKLMARLATKKAKPNGQFHIEAAHVADFVRGECVGQLPGIGHSLGSRLSDMDVQTCGELQKITLQRLEQEFGPKQGRNLFRLCRGLDDRPVVQSKERKSVSVEVNYGIRFECDKQSEDFLREIVTESCKRLQKAELLATKVTVKTMVRHPDAPDESAKFMGHGVCDVKNRSNALAQSTDQVDQVFPVCLRLYQQLNIKPSDLRGLGVHLGSLVQPHGRFRPVGVTLEDFLHRKPVQKRQKTTTVSEFGPLVESTPKRKRSPGKTPVLAKTCSSSKSLELSVMAQPFPAEQPQDDTDECIILSDSPITAPSTGTPSRPATVQNALPVAEILSFYGASTVAEIKDLLFAWSQAHRTSRPLPTDTLVFKQFLCRLVKHDFIDRVSSFLKFLRHITREYSEIWSSEIDEITDDVQSEMLERYNAPLEL